MFQEKFGRFLAAITFGLDGFTHDGKIIGNSVFLLNFIGSNQGCIISDVKRFLESNPSTTTRRVEKLVSLGLVERVLDNKDRRVFRLHLTDKGKKLYEHFLKKRLMGIEELFDKYSVDEIRIFISILDFFLEKGREMIREVDDGKG